IRLYRMALRRELIEPPMPWQLFVVALGANDIQRALAEAELPIDPEVFIPELAASIATNIAQGIVSLHEAGARMFLVANVPPIHLTPYGANREPMPQMQELLKAITNATNRALERALTRVENAYDKVKILRLDVADVYTSMVAMPGSFGLVNVTTPTFIVTDQGLVWLPVDPVNDPDNYDQNLFVSFDGFHPTVAAHAVVAQEAMNIIPIGSWWGHSMARGPNGHVWTRMGWMNDMHWPWVFSYKMQDGAWMWAYEEGGTPDGFFAYVPKGYKWIFVNIMSGWYYDYSTGAWQQMEP
ncbi:MAG TPA: SGNH/GDSL hydrolase family protein, partial [Oceanipulchritudo sp.]|nr:SGNH/GDSL hydrolase family protein [Oceanipulchritudo sp.]